MPSFSGGKQKIKQSRNHYSFSNLSQTTSTGQSTKKTIEPQQIILYQTQSIKDSKISFSLPYHIEISNIVNRLTNLFSEELIHVEQDSQGGKILINGIRNKKKKKLIINIMDSLGLCCWKYGLNGGSLYETYSVISILIKKQILNNRCFISIQQLPHHIDDKNIFISQIVLKVQEQLKKIQNTNQKGIQNIGISRYLSYDSIFVEEMEVKQKIYKIFIYEKDKKWERFRRLYRKSQQNIKQKIDQFKSKLNTQKNNKQQLATTNINKNIYISNNKKAIKQNPSSLIQAIINQSQALFRLLLNYYQKELQEEQQLTLFNALLSTPTQKQFTLYSIQQILSSQFIDSILACYQLCTEQQCILFNKNAKQINQKLNNQKCFDYLELRDKFRLTQLQHPYHPSIQILKTVPQSTSPRQLLLNIQKVFSSVKVDCFKASKGRIQLSSMDDLLPVVIFVTVKANVYNFPGFVKLIDDYVRLKGVFELQQRIITTLYVAVQDITKKWNV